MSEILREIEMLRKPEEKNRMTTKAKLVGRPGPKPAGAAPKSELLDESGRHLKINKKK